MYILTHHYSLLAISASDGTLKQVASLLPEEGHKLINLEPEDVARLHAASSGPGARGVIISSGALAAYEYVEGHAAGSFSLFKEGFVSASPEEDKVTHDRKVAMTWETFHFVDPEEAFAQLQVPHQREEALEARAIAHLEQKLPVCLHFGCAATRINGFLNIDKYASFGDPKDYFLLDFAEKSWPIPDSSVV